MCTYVHTYISTLSRVACSVVYAVCPVLCMALILASFSSSVSGITSRESAQTSYIHTPPSCQLHTNTCVRSLGHATAVWHSAGMQLTLCGCLVLIHQHPIDVDTLL